MLPLLLLTRPLVQSRRFAVEADAALPPHETVIAPLSEVVPVPYDSAVFDGARGLVLTSANAVPQLPPLPGLPAWCVGPATARAARAAGFDPRDGGGDAAALIEVLSRERPAGPLVHAHGLHVARDLVAAMASRGITLRGVTVYAARVLDLPTAVRPRLTGQSAVVAPLFSPRAARHFARQPGVADAPALRLVAISPACAAALPDILRARCRIADAPDGEAMLRALADAMSQDATPG